MLSLDVLNVAFVVVLIASVVCCRVLVVLTGLFVDDLIGGVVGAGRVTFELVVKLVPLVVLAKELKLVVVTIGVFVGIPFGIELGILLGITLLGMLLEISLGISLGTLLGTIVGEVDGPFDGILVGD